MAKLKSLRIRIGSFIFTISQSHFIIWLSEYCETGVKPNTTKVYGFDNGIPDPVDFTVGEINDIHEAHSILYYLNPNVCTYPTGRHNPNWDNKICTHCGATIK